MSSGMVPVKKGGTTSNMNWERNWGLYDNPVSDSHLGTITLNSSATQILTSYYQLTMRRRRDGLWENRLNASNVALKHMQNELTSYDVKYLPGNPCNKSLTSPHTHPERNCRPAESFRV